MQMAALLTICLSTFLSQPSQAMHKISLGFPEQKMQKVFSSGAHKRLKKLNYKKIIKRTYNTKHSLKPIEYAGVEINRDKFGNLWPKWQPLDKKLFPSKMKDILEGLKNKYPEKAFIIHLKPEDFGYAKSLIDVGFSVHFTDDTRMELIAKNGSPIPPPATAISGAKIFLVDHSRVLFVNPKHQKDLLMIPGGGIDPEEFALNACVRELQEETGYIVDPKDLKLVAATNRIKVNPYGSSDHCFYYTTNKFSGHLAPQKSELCGAFWVYAIDLVTSTSDRYWLQDGTRRELQITLTTKEILDHIYHGAKEQKILTIPDLRQQLKKPEERDPKDIMHLHLFALNQSLINTTIYD